MESLKVEVRRLPISDYAVIATEMDGFTNQRDTASHDQFWLLQHHPVFTLGTSCVDRPHYNPQNFPVIKSSRGGQITYHGPGQLVVYLLLDLKRLGIGPKSLVFRVEQALINLLNHYGLDPERKKGAPGIYINDAKIAALGLRIRNGRTFHGLSLNVDMDLTPFQWIDPCGFENLEVTSLSELGINHTVGKVGDDLVQQLTAQLTTNN